MQQAHPRAFVEIGDMTRYGCLRPEVKLATRVDAFPELLPPRIRATGMSLAYAIGVALFGGTTQFVITWLIEAAGNPACPAWYVAFTSAITALAMLALSEGRDKAIQHSPGQQGASRDRFASGTPVPCKNQNVWRRPVMMPDWC